MAVKSHLELGVRSQGAESKVGAPSQMVGMSSPPPPSFLPREKIPMDPNCCKGCVENLSISGGRVSDALKGMSMETDESFTAFRVTDTPLSSAPTRAQKGRPHLCQRSSMALHMKLHSEVTDSDIQLCYHDDPLSSSWRGRANSVVPILNLPGLVAKSDCVWAQIGVAVVTVHAACHLERVLIDSPDLHLHCPASFEHRHLVCASDLSGR